MAYFQHINNVQEFNYYVQVLPEFNHATFLPARLFHNGRYLSGYVDASLQAGFFIYKNEAQMIEIRGVGPYGFDLLLNWEDNLEWRLHLLEHELDLVDAFPADPLAQDEFLYFGRCKLNGVYYYGPVRSDGMIYILTPEGTMRELPEFDILTFKIREVRNFIKRTSERRFVILFKSLVEDIGAVLPLSSANANHTTGKMPECYWVLMQSDETLEGSLFAYKLDSDEFETLAVDGYPFLLLCDTEDKLEWRQYQQGDLESERAFRVPTGRNGKYENLGRIRLLNSNPIGQVCEDGFCYVPTLHNGVIRVSEFEILMYRDIQQ
ncbi:Hypothetical predicted protein [Cloeon dipterum]|uniref:Uncharacterized protein n=1 Tax=Cloeon dipterum TaxID=197152 RepID=A0A8S1DUJ3_9INSE|nr:Hypothetical predicted protein [Cloeon dipterum]